MKTIHTPNEITLVESDLGSLHCLQACLRMLVWGFEAVDLSWEEAESLSGYREGHYTWPYALLNHLSARGYRCNSVEFFDPRGMSNDPVAAILAAYGDNEVGREIAQDIDAVHEMTESSRCLDDERISFEVRPPSFDDIRAAIDVGLAVLVSVDYGVLHGTGAYEGHMILVVGCDDESVLAYDPGPPGRGPIVLPARLVTEAMLSPDEDGGAVISVARDLPEPHRSNGS